MTSEMEQKMKKKQLFHIFLQLRSFDILPIAQLRSIHLNTAKLRLRGAACGTPTALSFLAELFFCGSDRSLLFAVVLIGCSRCHLGGIGRPLFVFLFREL